MGYRQLCAVLRQRYDDSWWLTENHLYQLFDLTSMKENTADDLNHLIDPITCIDEYCDAGTLMRRVLIVVVMRKLAGS